MNVGNSKVMRCSRYVNVDLMHMRLNGELLEEVDCFKCLWSHVATDGGCERDVVHKMNEGYKAWSALESVISNRGLGIITKKYLYYMKEQLYQRRGKEQRSGVREVLREGK